MYQGTVSILLANREALHVAASAARISTQSGSALSIYEQATDTEKDLKLIGKVMASGHKSVIEHQTFSLAFNNVSVLVEQFVIEFRLASYTVKSRRYVDFSDAGFITPGDMPPEIAAIYEARSQQLFADYNHLLKLGIPKEDARFLLPYGFCSNFYMTLDARELLKMVNAMLNGRGRQYWELRELGRQLGEQMDKLYPGIQAAEAGKQTDACMEEDAGPIMAGDSVEPRVRLVGTPTDPVGLLDAAMHFGRRFSGFNEENLRALLCDERSRELEILNYSFRIDNVSLACVTHFTRHRMISLLVRHEMNALAEGNYVLPESVAANAEAQRIYSDAFAAQSAAAIAAQEQGAGIAQLSYFALAGNTTSILIGMNARELLHFTQLRACARAQWEIRGITRAMIELLNETEARPIFRNFGPTCAVRGRCPEGKMSCGHPVSIQNGIWESK